MRSPSVKARHADLGYWIAHEIVSSRRWGYGFILFGLALMGLGGRSFWEQLSAGLVVEKMVFPGQLPMWGLIFAVFGVLSLVRAPRHYKRLRSIVAEGKPETMYLTVRVQDDSESTHYYADLRWARNRTAPAPDIEVSLDDPPWPEGHERLMQRPRDVCVQVHGVRAGRLVVIETEWGWFWSSGSVSRKDRQRDARPEQTRRAR
jgi:hypothetical protein